MTETTTATDIGLAISTYGFPVTIKNGKLITGSKKDRKARESMATSVFARPPIMHNKDGPQLVQVSVWDFASADIYVRLGLASKDGMILLPCRMQATASYQHLHPLI